MNFPEDFLSTSEQILEKLFFKLSESNDSGMTKSFVWRNNLMKLTFIYDRGYYECFISAERKPFEELSLIKLLRFLKNDADFLKSELINANLWYTLPVNEYVNLLDAHYDLIKTFIENYSKEAFDLFNKYEVSYNGI